MKKIIILAFTSILFTNNCVYMDVKTNATIFNKDVSQDKGIGSKTGEACVKTYAGLVSLGDSSLKTATENGKIKEVRSLDISQFSILFFLYMKTCTIVNGD
jgi:hypothetical protein